MPGTKRKKEDGERKKTRFGGHFSGHITVGRSLILSSEMWQSIQLAIGCQLKGWRRIKSAICC
jgi:hypothetical protein